MGTRGREDVVRVIDERQRDYRWSRQVEVPKLQENTARTLDADDTPAGLELGGMGVSPGRVTGVARVVTDPRSSAYIEPGEILVAPVTDVAWTPLFAQAAGLVVEVGGRGKGRQQFKGVTIDRKLIFADTDVPGDGRIPLFLAGFMA